VGELTYEPHLPPCRLRQASAGSQGSLEQAQARLRERDEEVRELQGGSVLTLGVGCTIITTA
jgi:hypothetical protein